MKNSQPAHSDVGGCKNTEKKPFMPDFCTRQRLLGR